MNFKTKILIVFDAFYLVFGIMKIKSIIEINEKQFEN